MDLFQSGVYKIGSPQNFFYRLQYSPFKSLRGLPSAPGSPKVNIREHIPRKGGFLMRHYELVCIVHPDLDETAFSGVIEKVKGWIVETGGNVDKVEIWGRKRLAYPIKKHREGQYVLFNLSLEPTTSAILDQNLRFLEPVIRYMITAVQ
jgi:small subunit ribosomal protein S6